MNGLAKVADGMLGVVQGIRAGIVLPSFWSPASQKTQAAPSLPGAEPFWERPSMNTASLRAKVMEECSLEVQNSTLQYVAEELHDNVGQLLLVMQLYLNRVEQASQLNEAREWAVKTSSILAETLSEVQSLSKSFHAGTVKELGLAASIMQEMARLEQTGSLKTTLTVSGTVYSLGHRPELFLFRIVQELMANTIRHAGASQLDIDLCFYPHHFFILVRDNGNGFDAATIPNTVSRRAGSGLRNVQRRITAIGGNCTVRSTGAGTTVELSVPNDFW